MKIALIGYGKMGKAIEEIATERGHEIVLRITSANIDEMTAEALQLADVAIEFSIPDQAYANVIKCLQAGVNTICGTTGWHEQSHLASNEATASNSAFLLASNFSIGVNIFFEINEQLAILMNGQNEYSVAVEETHHVHKKDMPGGTAITIAQQIIKNISRKTNWALGAQSDVDLLPVIANRVGEVPGTHKVKYSSPVDDIEIIHTAHSRKGFAFGAILAAEFIIGKQGTFTMKDVLGITG